MDMGREAKGGRREAASRATQPGPARWLLEQGVDAGPGWGRHRRARRGGDVPGQGRPGETLTPGSLPARWSPAEEDGVREAPRKGMRGAAERFREIRP